MDRVLIITQDYDYPKFVMKHEYHATPENFAKRICHAHACDFRFRKIHLDQFDINDEEDIQILETIEKLCHYAKADDTIRYERFNDMWKLGRSANINVDVC